MLYHHREWTEQSVCYVIQTPPENAEDLNTIMNIPNFFLSKWGRNMPPPAGP